MLIESVLQYELPGSSEEKETDSASQPWRYFLSQCQYARICCSIATVCLAGDARGPDASLLTSLLEQLGDWYDLAQKPSQPREQPMSPALEGRHSAVHTLFQYEEANLAILDLMKSCDLGAALPLTPSQMLLSSAKHILSGTNKIEHLMYDR